MKASKTLVTESDAEIRRTVVKKLVSLVDTCRVREIITSSEGTSIKRLIIKIISEDIKLTNLQIESFGQIRLLFFENHNLYDKLLLKEEEYKKNNSKLIVKLIETVSILTKDRMYNDEKIIASRKVDETSVIKLRSMMSVLYNQS